jgi:hypothetical protein
MILGLLENYAHKRHDLHIMKFFALEEDVAVRNTIS